MYLWQPGAKEARKLPDLGAYIEVAADSDTFGYTTYNGKGRACSKAATLGANGPEVKREYCSEEVAGYGLSFSPNGETMLVAGTWVAIDVATGKNTKLRLPTGLIGANPVVFEDATDVIVLGMVPTKPSAQTIYRCRVTTGECKALVTEKSGEVFAVAKN